MYAVTRHSSPFSHSIVCFRNQAKYTDSGGCDDDGDKSIDNALATFLISSIVLGHSSMVIPEIAQRMEEPVLSGINRRPLQNVLHANI